jgi:hypothetical protein
VLLMHLIVRAICLQPTIACSSSDNESAARRCAPQASS